MTLLLRGLRWIGKHELGSIVAMFVVAFGGLAFAELASEVSEGDSASVDQALLLAMRNPTDLSDPIGPRWVEEAGRDFTALGGRAVLTLLTVAVAGYLLLLRKSRAALFVVGSILGAAILQSVLKSMFARPRPDLVPHLAFVESPSFPSGHSMLSAAAYLTLGALLARMQTSRIVKAYMLLCALALAVIVGVSRVYIGVHWPTDVLAGWAAGAVWAALCWVAARALQRRGEIEPPQRPPKNESV
jgi:undecaprenyl-diphosphatase